MTDRCEILVLVADDNNATISSNTNGESRLLRTFDRIQPRHREIGGSEAAHANRHVFACELIMALGRSAGECSCDGVVIYADASMMDELRQVQTSVIARLIVAQIVGKPARHSQFPGRSVANAELAYRGAVQ
ncbi:MAG: hypothetical protein JWP16_1190 [Alphaproteobacteria bacterium]|nr:hypothetical protein [Alphaproteobacteria bacterium]MDB5740150.1 hypothetical protein [Alphaproteobacteria bacterium]